MHLTNKSAVGTVNIKWVVPTALYYLFSVIFNGLKSVVTVSIEATPL